MRILSVADVEYIGYDLAKKLMTFDEPIPDFVTRYPDVLERCLIAPFQTYDNRDLYPTLIKKSAILFYLMIKNHPFQNGNKRIAVATSLFFLADNNKWLKISNQELYNFAKWVAESNANLKDATVNAVEKFISLYIVDL
ncbi:MAG: type II toxin-antitoxin system death-on-curing family toxin [Candidatus Pacebacteria bacterium]|nr:type II toxin-antitoxin system death-on-curing family toxin [Candidatus Paceibacterota bacterium]